MLIEFLIEAFTWILYNIFTHARYISILGPKPLSPFQRNRLATVITVKLYLDILLQSLKVSLNNSIFKHLRFLDLDHKSRRIKSKGLIKLND